MLQAHFPIDGVDAALFESAAAEGRVGFASQDIVAVVGGAVLYAECLARVTDSGGEVHSAGIFVPSLEALGRVGLLDISMAQLALNRLDDIDGALGINLSPETLLDRTDWRRFYQVIAGRSDLARRLVIEITETRPLTDTRLVMERLAELRALGCRVAVDDFGSGYATPALWRVLQPDIVKIDAFFIQGDTPATAIARCLPHIVRLAQCFAPVVVVEGVETSDQLDLVGEAGASHSQGYLFSRPSGYPS